MKMFFIIVGFPIRLVVFGALLIILTIIYLFLKLTMIDEDLSREFQGYFKDMVYLILGVKQE